jgi:hypothetical protein
MSTWFFFVPGLFNNFQVGAFQVFHGAITLAGGLAPEVPKKLG